MDILKENNDNRNMDKMLLHLSPYGPDHHSREIAKLFDVFISNKFTSLPPYLQSRILQTRAVREIERGIFNESSKNPRETIIPGISKASFWIKDSEKERLLRKPVLQLDNGSADIEKEIRVEYIDIATLHCFHENSEGFFEALSQCENYELFEEKAIKTIIDFKWPILKEFNI